MTIYFMGGEIGAFVPSDGTTNETAGFANSSFTRGALECGEGSDTQYGESATFAAADDCWYHFDHHRGTVATTISTAFALTASGTDVFRVRATFTTLQMQVRIAGVWTSIGSAVTYSGNDLQTIDLHIVGNSPTGSATLYLSGTERATATADFSAVTGITNVRSYGINSATGAKISQVVVRSTPTIGVRLLTRFMSGAGATSAWTGTFAGIDEFVYSDADFIYSDTANQVSTFATSGPSISGYRALAVGVYARAKEGGSGPGNLQLALRVNGTDYFSATKALGLGYGAIGAIWEANPDTTVDWLAADIAAVQPGVKSIT